MAATPTRPDPRWNRLEPDERRRQILECAQRLFGERGYAAVSTEEIAQAAGVRRGLLNHYFGTKRDLFLEVVGEMLRMTIGLLWTAGEDLPLDELVASSVDEWLDLVEHTSEMWFAVIGAEGFGRDPELEQMLDRAREATVQRVLDVLGMADADETTRAVLRSYVSLAEEATREWLQRRRLSKAGTRALLSRTLLALLVDVTPAVREEELQSSEASAEPA